MRITHLGQGVVLMHTFIPGRLSLFTLQVPNLPVPGGWWNETNNQPKEAKLIYRDNAFQYGVYQLVE